MDLKKILSKSADVISDTAKKSTEVLNDVTKKVKNQIDETPKDLTFDKIADKVSDMTKKGGEALNNLKKNSDENNRMVNEALNSEKKTGGSVTTADALKVFYYLMSADGKVKNEELDQFNAIGKEMDPDFTKNREAILTECGQKTGNPENAEEYYDSIHDSISDTIRDSRGAEHTDVPGLLLLWDMIAIAYSDRDLGKDEGRLIHYAAKVLEVDSTVVLEIENSAETVIAINREEEWLKQSGREYSAVELQIKELAVRRESVMQGIHALLVD